MNTSLLNLDDVKDFDALLKRRIAGFRAKLADWLAAHRLTLAEARVSKVLVPMGGMYTPGWQAMPACSWGFVELVTKGGLAALMYDEESTGLYMGTTPRACHPIDNETIQMSDDVIQGGPFDWTGGHLKLSTKPGHGQKLDPERGQVPLYPRGGAPHREYAKKLYANYQLDHPRRTTQSGWPKPPGPERFDGQSYPYSIQQILGAQEHQDFDVELNR